MQVLKLYHLLANSLCFIMFDNSGYLKKILQKYHNQIIHGSNCIGKYRFCISRIWIGAFREIMQLCIVFLGKENRKTVAIFAKSILLQEKREEIIDRKQSICQTYILVFLKFLQRHPSSYKIFPFRIVHHWYAF